MTKKPSIIFSIVLGQGIMFLFIFADFITYDMSSPFNIWADSALRIIFGVAALLLTKKLYGEKFASLFTAKISKKTWIYCIPIFIYIFLELLYLPGFDNLNMSYTRYFLTVCFSQLATGLLEETASKGLVMFGMLQKWTETFGGRVLTIVISGFLFGSLHLVNLFFGNDLPSTLFQFLSSSIFGMITAAIFLYTENLLLCIIIHAVWDIVIRIPSNFFDYYQQGPWFNSISIFQSIIQFVVFPVVAILICKGCNFEKNSPEKNID